MNEHDDLTRDQLSALVKQRERETVEENRKYLAERDENKRLRLVLRGMSDEKFTLRVELDPTVLSRDAWEAVQWMLKNYVGQTAHAIEQKIGGPLRRLQEALMHIHYLENHAASRGVQFTPWSVRESDKWLYH